MQNTIAFPGLGIDAFKINEYIEIFGFKIHWYGVIIALGVILGYLLATHDAKKRGLSADTMTDILLFGLPSAVVCARIYYVLFEFDSYRDNLISVFKIWEGGIAIYGAIIGACLSTFIYCKKKNVNIKKAFDSGAFGLICGQAIGRWGNFVNAEAFGGETRLPWRMELLDLGISVHPTFLYESLWNFGVLLVMLKFRKKQKFDGENFLLYITLYGLGRFWIEGLRTDSLFLGAFRVSQVLALICAITGFVLIIFYRKKCGEKI